MKDQAQNAEATVWAGEWIDAPKLGLLGGSFDPVHLGHLHVAHTALETFGLDAIVFVPAARSPHKAESTRAPADDRLAMLELALAGEARFALTDMELKRGAPSYTVDTIRDLVERRAAQPRSQLYLILGSDNLTGLETWRDIERVLELTIPITVARRGSSEAILNDLTKLSGSARARLQRGFVAAETVDISATELREALAVDRGESKLSAAVWEYIRTRGIYRAL